MSCMSCIGVVVIIPPERVVSPVSFCWDIEVLIVVLGFTIIRIVAIARFLLTTQGCVNPDDYPGRDAKSLL